MTEDIFLQRINEMLQMQQDILSTLSRLTAKSALPSLEWYDSADIKRLLNISDTTLFRLRRSNSIKSVKISGKRFYKIPDFEDLTDGNF